MGLVVDLLNEKCNAAEQAGERKCPVLGPCGIGENITVSPAAAC